MQPIPPAKNRFKVAVIEDDEAVRLAVVQTLEQILGHKVVGEASTGLEMIEIVLQSDPDIILFDIHLPQLNGLEALRRICEKKPAAAVAITGDRDPALLRRACQEHVQAYLIKPFELHQLGPALEVAITCFAEVNRLGMENDKLQKTLDNRKLIERAKGVLMKRHRWTEGDAFRRLQRAAMNQRTTMADLARQILEGKAVPL